MKAVLVPCIPMCDICETAKAKYDAPTTNGSWANMCVKCAVKWMANSGIGSEFVLDERDEIEYDAEHEMTHATELTQEELAEMMFDGIVEAADGCHVEPDGRCPHNYRSPLVVLGII